MARALVQKPKDNVATLLESVKKDESVEFQLNDEKISIIAQEEIRFGHKIAIKDIQKGEAVYKYGYVIGKSTDSIKQGYHAHVHNIDSLRGRGDLKERLS